MRASEAVPRNPQVNDDEPVDDLLPRPTVGDVSRAEHET